MKRCTCGNPIEQPPTGRRRKHCSDVCRTREHRRRRDAERNRARARQARRRTREQEFRESRNEAEERARASGLRADVVCADVHTWRPEGVSVIITDPPYITDDVLELHEALRDFAVDVLPDGGALAVLTWQPILPGVLDALRHPELVYRWTASWRYADRDENAYTRVRQAKVFSASKPVLVFHKTAVPADAMTLYDDIPSTGRVVKDHHVWEQDVAGFERLVQSFTLPGQLVCDPFLGSGTTGVAALANARHFTGADIDPEAVEVARARLSLERGMTRENPADTVSGTTKMAERSVNSPGPAQEV